MAVNIPGLIAVVVFYIIILVIGIIAGRKTARSNSSDEIFLANRSLGLGVAMFTLTASLVGGAYINGTAEVLAFQGLLWTQAPVGYCLALFIGELQGHAWHYFFIIVPGSASTLYMNRMVTFCVQHWISVVFVPGGIFYAPKMRRGGYVTMFDPFQIKYGKKIGGLLFFPQLLGDLFWTAAILSALGSTVSIILGIDAILSIIVSACVVIFYTFLGGLYSVAYTDVIQLFCIVIGLLLAFPFAMKHPAVDLTNIKDTWLGTVPSDLIASYIDMLLLLVCGGIPWQTYFQRVLACRTPEVARIATCISSVFCLLMAVPPALIGAVGAAADWNATSYDGPIPIPENRRSFILPLVLNHICPLPIGIIGIGAVSAAVMSSADSCVLSTGSVFTKNIYKDILRHKASEREMVWVLRTSIVVVGIIATVVAILVQSVYGLFTLCSDLMYVILFPQLTCVLWVSVVNAYGCLTGYILSLVLRIGAGEPLLGMPPFIYYPFYDETNDVQRFPFRTFITVISFGSIIGVSAFATMMFEKGWIPLKFDIFKAVKKDVYRRNSLRMMLKNPPRVDSLERDTRFKDKGDSSM